MPNYLENNKPTQTDWMSQISNIVGSIPVPGAQLVGAAMKITTGISKGIDSATAGLGYRGKDMKNAQGIDKVWNVVNDLPTGFNILTSAANLGAEALGISTRTTVKSEEDLMKNISGYTPTEGIQETEISKGRDLLSVPFNMMKDTFKNRKDKNYLKESGQLKNYTASSQLQDKAKKIDYINFQKQQESKKAKDTLALSESSFRDVLSKNQQALTGGQKFLLYKKGAKMSTLKRIKKQVERKRSVIPDGKLHSRLNSHLEEVTKKGIPVISYQEGKVIQHAEIEKEELILSLDITKKLENLRDEYNKAKDDSILIKAGELLTFEILENTDDNVNLISKV